MAIEWRRLIQVSNRSTRQEPRAAAWRRGLSVGLIGLVASSCGGDGLAPSNPPVEVGSISIDVGSFTIERGFHRLMTATVRDKNGKTITVPLAWRSSDDKIATLDPNGRLAAVDTGIVSVTASSLGVSSQPVGVKVIWANAAKLDTFQWSSPSAASPGSVVNDSIRVQATNLAGGPAVGAIVKFAVTGGGGTLSVTTVTTGQSGVASTRWTLGPSLGANSATATVINDDSVAISWVTGNPAKFAVTAFKPLAVVDGDAQTGQILDSLPVAPSVRLVDSAGKPRVGVPLTFTPTNGGRVTTRVVSTGADGIASPGTWTLGDIPGDQTLIVRVESATLDLKAHATGTPIHYMPDHVTAGAFATCAIETDGLVSCLGAEPQVGDGDTAVKSIPTPTSGGIHFQSVVGSPALVPPNTVTGHFCGVSVDGSIYCWGVAALQDTSASHLFVPTPTRVASDFTWSQVSVGLNHACGLTVDHVAYCWGKNSNGQLGNRDTALSLAPTPVYGGFNFTTISSGSSHTCGLTADGTALCWGVNSQGQLGDGTTTDRLSPTVVVGGVSFKAIGEGDAWTCGLSKAGQAYCWGTVQGVGQSVTSPHLYADAPVFTALAVGGFHACALTADGTPYCWGNNQAGQLGDSTSTLRANPTLVAGGFKLESISAGFFHTCGQTADNSVVCWGLNSAGELGEKLKLSGAFRVVPRYIVLGVTP